MISSAGREVCLKAIAMAIPTFSMTCFKLTKKVCKSLVSYMAKYWWSSSLDRRSMHWLSWEALAQPKAKGGMGFRDLEMFNTALLGKHGWGLITNPNTLCARVLKGKYYPSCEFLQATIPKHASVTWQAIIHGRKALNSGLIKRIGNGTTVNIWTDKWIPDTITMSPVSRLGKAQINSLYHIIYAYIWPWQWAVVMETFNPPPPMQMQFLIPP